MIRGARCANPYMETTSQALQRALCLSLIIHIIIITPTIIFSYIIIIFLVMIIVVVPSQHHHILCCTVLIGKFLLYPENRQGQVLMSQDRNLSILVSGDLAFEGAVPHCILHILRIAYCTFHILQMLEASSFHCIEVELGKSTVIFFHLPAIQAVLVYFSNILLPSALFLVVECCGPGSSLPRLSSPIC